MLLHNMEHSMANSQFRSISSMVLFLEDPHIIWLQAKATVGSLHVGNPPGDRRVEHLFLGRKNTLEKYSIVLYYYGSLYHP